MRSGIGPLLCVCTGKKPSGRSFPPQVNRGTSLCTESSGPALDERGAADDQTPRRPQGSLAARARARRTCSKLSGEIRQTLWTNPSIHPLTSEDQPHTTSGRTNRSAKVADSLESATFVLVTTREAIAMPVRPRRP